MSRSPGVKERKKDTRDALVKTLYVDLDRLEREKRYLDMSLLDLEAEHDAGDLNEDDYVLLNADYRSRSNRLSLQVRKLLEQIEDLSDQKSISTDEKKSSNSSPDDFDIRRTRSNIKRFLGKRTTRRYLAIALILSFVTALSATAYSLADNRLPGQFATGSVSLTKQALIRQQLLQAQVLGSEGRLQSAVQLYGEVLSESGRNVTALAYQGWLIRLIGKTSGSRKLLITGDREIAKAVLYSPQYANAHAFYAIALLQDFADTKGAVLQLNDFLQDQPSRQFLSVLGKQIADTYLKLHLTVPNKLKQFARR
ncbi:MAG: hypothetical protein M1374_04325 [Firmicutes bacterium]|nr:hypothetical protein [Bacillota bacterium]